jgi:hypothetical protein
MKVTLVRDVFVTWQGPPGTNSIQLVVTLPAGSSYETVAWTPEEKSHPVAADGSTTYKIGSSNQFAFVKSFDVVGQRSSINGPINQMPGSVTGTTPTASSFLPWVIGGLAAFLLLKKR